MENLRLPSKVYVIPKSPCVNTGEGEHSADNGDSVPFFGGQRDTVFPSRFPAKKHVFACEKQKCEAVLVETTQRKIGCLSVKLPKKL